MSQHVYRVIEIVGSSASSIDDAIHTAIARASQTLHGIDWFEVKETRGHVQDGHVGHFQVTLRIGFKIDDPLSAQ